MSDFNVGFVIFPGITQLDFTGPFEVLSRLGTPAPISVPCKFPQSRTHVVAKTMHPVSSDRGLGIMPTCTFEKKLSSARPDLLARWPRRCGSSRGCRDRRLHSPKRKRTVRDLCMHGRFSSWCSRVAEGASGGDALGLRRLVALGRRKSRKGASRARRQCLHCGRAFRIVAELAGPEVAQAIQLAIEYDPSPPFDAGHPDKAPRAATALMVQRNRMAHTGIKQGLEKMAILARGSSGAASRVPSV